MGLFELIKDDCSSGGALLEKMALRGDPKKFLNLSLLLQKFCLHNKDCNFSFAGLLSATYRLIEKEIQTSNEKIVVENIEKLVLNEKTICDISASVQTAINLELVILIFFCFSIVWMYMIGICT